MPDTKTADELEIRNVIARLAFLADNPNIDELGDYLACFTEDAIWDMAGAVAKGRAEILEGAIQRRKANTTGARGWHFVPLTNVRLTGDTAVAESYFQFFSGAVTPPALQVLGHYLDTFTNTAEGWKLAHRVISFS